MNSSTATGPTRETQIIRTFLELADTLVADFDIIDSLTVLAARCVDILDAAATGILLVDADGQLRVIAASGEQARLIELFQLQNDEGPSKTTKARVWKRSRRVTQSSIPICARRSSGGHDSRPTRSVPDTCRCMRSRCGCAATSSVRSTCSESTLDRSAATTLPSRKHWPTSPASPSCKPRRRANHNDARNNSNTRSTVGSSSNKPKACSPNTHTSTCRPRSTRYAPVPATPTPN